MAEQKIVCPHCGGVVVLKVDTSKRLIAEKGVDVAPPAKPKPPDDDVMAAILGGDDDE